MAEIAEQKKVAVERAYAMMSLFEKTFFKSRLEESKRYLAALQGIIEEHNLQDYDFRLSEYNFFKIIFGLFKQIFGWSYPYVVKIAPYKNKSGRNIIKIYQECLKYPSKGLKPSQMLVAVIDQNP
jgi:hypothetical protein